MAEPTLLEQLTGVQVTEPANAALLGASFAAVIVAAQIIFKLTRAIRGAITGRRAPRADMVATIIGAGLVLALSIEGMWRFFGAIGMPVWGRIAFAAVFEICLLAVALRARHTRLLRQSRKDALIERRSQVSDEDSSAERLDAEIAAIRLRSINDLLVWVFAGVIGTLAALEAPTQPEQVARFLVPFIAATMWELALGADVEDQRVTATAKHWADRVKAGFVAFGRSCTSAAVKFGWVPPTSADATQQYREKRMTQLVDVSHRIHTAAETQPPKLLDRQRRIILDLQARGQWTRETLAELGDRLDVIFRAVELTAPAAVRAVPPLPKAAPDTTPGPAPVPRPVSSVPRKRRGRALKVDDRKIFAAYEEWIEIHGKAPTVRELAAATGYGKSTTGKWLKGYSSTDNGQEAA